jgi:uncharacterized protein YpmB
VETQILHAIANITQLESVLQQKYRHNPELLEAVGRGREKIYAVQLTAQGVSEETAAKIVKLAMDMKSSPQ